jgi:hypothetical protein
MKSTKYKTVKVKDLQVDDWFIVIGKRKERCVSKVWDIVHPIEGRTILVITDYCQQIKFEPDDHVYWVKNQSRQSVYEDFIKSYFSIEWYEKLIQENEERLLSADLSTNMSGRHYTDRQVRVTINHNIEEFEIIIKNLKNCTET